MSQVKIRDQMSIKTSCSDWLTRREYKSRASNEIYRVTKSISDSNLQYGPRTRLVRGIYSHSRTVQIAKSQRISLK